MIFKSEKWQPHVWKNEAFCQKVQQCKCLQKKVFSKIVGSLSNDGGNGDENRKKTMFLSWQTTTLHVIMLFYISLPLLHGYNVKVPKFTFCWECEHNTTTCFFFSQTLIQCFRFNSRKICNIWWIERVGISAIKFEGEWIHFLSDVFKAVAVVVA